MQLFDAATGRHVLSVAVGAFEPSGGLDPLQRAVVDGLAESLFGVDVAEHPIEALTADQALALGLPEVARHRAVCIMVVLELIVHPLPPDVAASVEACADRLGVRSGLVRDARELADQHLAVMYADLQRSSWYTRQTIHGALHGRFRELVRSKLAYTGIIGDRAIAERWEALRQCPPGSWGKAVADFYHEHDFPFPGERHGIYEIGARHDFVHVLADYPPTPEGELDVFAFIAASMAEESGFVLLAVTLGLFQNGSIHRVAGKVVKIARTDTLSDPGAVDHFTEAFRRGARTTVDVMGGIDHLALAPEPLEDVRRRFGVTPLAEPAAEASTS